MANEGLSEAIALENRSTGAQPNSFLSGLRQGDLFNFRQQQKDAAAAEKQRKAQEDFAKKMTFDPKGLDDPETLKKAKEMYKEKGTEAVQKLAAGDKAGADAVVNEMGFQAQLLKNQNDFAKHLMKEDPLMYKAYLNGSSTHDVDENGNPKNEPIGGFKNLDNVSENLFWRPNSFERTADGQYVPVKVPTTDINKAVNVAVSTMLTQGLPTTYIGKNKSGQHIYKTDKKSPIYADNRKKTVDELMGDEEFTNSILRSEEFNKKAVEENYKSKKQTGQEITPDKIHDLLLGEVEKLVDNSVQDKVEVKSPVRSKSSSSSSDNPRYYIGGEVKDNYQLGFDEDGKTLVKVKGGTNAAPKMSGYTIYERKDGTKTDPEWNNAATVNNPIVEFLTETPEGLDKSKRYFKVTGSDKDEENIVMYVPESQIREEFHLTDEGMRNKFNKWYPKGSKEAKESAKMTPIKNPIIKNGVVR